MREFSLGDKVEDKLTGKVGVVVAYVAQDSFGNYELLVEFGSERKVLKDYELIKR